MRDKAERLQRTYTSLGLGELAATLIFAGAAASGLVPVTRTPSGAAALWSALIPLLAILVQAGCYWLLARRWVGRAPMPTGLASLYRLFRVLNPVLLVAGLVGVVAWLPSGLNAVLVVAVWLFGVVEYVNYYVVRLSYPPTRWLSRIGQWRVPRLVQDLRDASRPASGDGHQSRSGATSVGPRPD